MNDDADAIDMFRGLRIHWSEYATKAGDPVQVRLTWRRRLLSWPWRPWVASYTRTPQVPAMYQAGHLLIAHPAMRSELATLGDGSL